MIARVSRPELSWSSPFAAGIAALALGLLLGAGAVLLSPLATLTAFLAAALIVAVLREPLLGLYALIGLVLLLPFAVIPARLGVQVTALETILVLAMAATLVRALARRERFRASIIVWLLLSVLGLATISFVLNVPHAGETAEVGRGFIKLALAMLVLPLTLRLVREPGQVGGLLIALMLCGSLEAGISVALYGAPRESAIQLLSSLSPLGYPSGEAVLRFLPGENDTYTDVVRATGTVIDPNVLGAELMLVSAILVSQLFAPRPLLPRWSLLSLSALTLWGMSLTHSRSSWVGLAFALIVLATLRYRRLLPALALGGLAVWLLPVGRVMYARLLSGFAGQDKAAAMRVDEYRNALEIIQQHPMFGIGFGNPPSIDLAPGVSSLYLTVAETAGLPALALYLAAMALLLTRSLRVSLQPEVQGSLASLQAAIIAALCAGLFDHYFASTSFPHMVALFWLCSALLWRLSVPQNSSARRLDDAGQPTHALRRSESWA